MNKKAIEMQKALDEYRAELPIDGPVSADDFVMWLLENKKWAIPYKSIFSACKKDVTTIFRQDYIKDSKGRKVRAKLATKTIQGVLWDDIMTIDLHQMKRNVVQRRKQVVADLYQLKVDVDFFNENHPEENPIQLALDFHADMLELDLEHEEMPECVRTPVHN